MKGYDKDIVYFCVTAMVIGLIYFWITESKKSEMLSQNTKIDFGFFESKANQNKGTYFYTYNYFVKGKKFILESRFGHHSLQKKDTVLIKYSLKDPTYCEIENSYYMRKYRGLRKY